MLKLSRWVNADEDFFDGHDGPVNDAISEAIGLGIDVNYLIYQARNDYPFRKRDAGPAMMLSERDHFLIVIRGTISTIRRAKTERRTEHRCAPE